MNNSTPLPTLYTITEIHEQTKVSRFALKRAVSSGQIPAIKLGGRWFVTEATVRAHLRLTNDVHLTKELPAH